MSTNSWTQRVKTYPDTALLQRSVQLFGMVLVAIILILRRGQQFWYPQLWFEDGPVFFQDAYNLPFWQAIAKPFFNTYPAYYLFLDRLFAEIAVLFRIELVPTIFMLLSFMVAWVVCCFFLLNCFRGIVPSVFFRLLVCVLFAALPGSYEILLRLVNIQWYLNILCFLLIFARISDRILIKILYLLAWMILCFSTPQFVVFLPLVIAKSLLYRENRMMYVLTGSIILFALISTLLLNAGVQSNTVIMPVSQAVAFINLFNARVLIAATMGVVRSFGWFYQTSISLLGYFWYLGYALLLWLVLGPLIKHKNREGLIIIAFCTYCMIVPVGLAILRNDVLVEAGQQLGTSWGGERYFILPIAAFYFMLVWWISTLMRVVGAAQIASVMLLLAFAGAVASDFSDPSATVDFQWNLQANRIKQAEVAATGSTIQVQINPDTDWAVSLVPRSSHFPVALPSVLSTTIGTGGFDFVGDGKSNTTLVAQNGVVLCAGWGLNSAATKPFESILIVDVASNKVLAYTSQHTPRADVAVQRNDESLFYSGWQVAFPVDQLSIGAHSFHAYVFNPETQQTLLLPGEQRVQIIASQR